MSNPRHATL
ncbi:hypothetical protein AZE42_11572 [Rhizopogon vesiculosus]|uniref:Uncharacterized protein n=1 Tax=Rhizopogon vesiculosus TaxID=180088 RepID=A0A1J8Q5L3_9AGAM|nr:hypothetical protein AZE42_11572 [Rhizopogon vesiculosus]